MKLFIRGCGLPHVSLQLTVEYLAEDLYHGACALARLYRASKTALRTSLQERLKVPPPRLHILSQTTADENELAFSAACLWLRVSDLEDIPDSLDDLSGAVLQD